MKFRVALFCVATCILASCSQQTKTTNNETLKIGYSRLRISLPVFVAQEKGFFKKNGLNVNLEMYDTAQPLMQALVEGKVDVAGYTALPITYNGILRSGKDLLFLSTMIEDAEHRISYLLRSTGKRGESIQTVADLKGKRIGILPTIAYKAWIENILKNNGLEPGVDVQIQQIAPTLQAQSLKSGGVDALFTNDPAATSSIQLGVAELVSQVVECPAYLKDPFPFGSFNVSKDWADENPDTFKRLVEALDMAIEFVNTYPIEAKQCMAPYLPEQFIPHVQYYPNARYLTTKESSCATFNDIAQLYLEIGIINSKIDLSGMIVNSSD